MLQLAHLCLKSDHPYACFMCPRCVVYSLQRISSPLQKQSSLYLRASMHQIIKACQFAGVLATQSVCVCAENTSSANKLYNNVRILNTFICKLVKFKSRFYVVQFLIIYYSSSAVTSFC